MDNYVQYPESLRDVFFQHQFDSTWHLFVLILPDIDPPFLLRVLGHNAVYHLLDSSYKRYQHAVLG